MGVIYVRVWMQVYAHTCRSQNSITATILEKRYAFVFVLGGGTALVKTYTQPAWVTEGNFISVLTTY